MRSGAVRGLMPGMQQGRRRQDGRGGPPRTAALHHKRAPRTKRSIPARTDAIRNKATWLIAATQDGEAHMDGRQPGNGGSRAAAGAVVLVMGKLSEGGVGLTRAGSGASDSCQCIGEEGGNVLLVGGGRQPAHVHPTGMPRGLLGGARCRKCCSICAPSRLRCQTSTWLLC